MFNTVSDVIVKAGKAKVYAYTNNGLSYIITTDGKRNRAYKTTSTDNKGLVLMSWPISRARMKLLANKLVDVATNGNVKVLRGSKGPRTVKVGKEA